MNRKIYVSQLNNLKTFEMKKRDLMSLAESVFVYNNLNEYIDETYMNRCLLKNGSIAFFKDEVLGVLALPYKVTTHNNMYNKPYNITVMGENGYTRNLSFGEFVIMYDNLAKFPIYIDLLQYAERLGLMTRVIDLNIFQQKYNRVWKTTKDKEMSLNEVLNKVDTFQENIITYENLFDSEDVQISLNVVPFIADKVQEQYDKLYNEFLRKIGISNLSIQKKERLIKDEFLATQGGTIALRYNRFEPRKKAIKEINEKFGTNIEVAFYDGLPTTLIDFEKMYSEKNDENEKGVDNYYVY